MRDRQAETTSSATISFLLENAVFLAMGLGVTTLTPTPTGAGRAG